MYQGLEDMSFKCPYQANVMNRLEQTSRSPVVTITGIFIFSTLFDLKDLNLSADPPRAAELDPFPGNVPVFSTGFLS